MFHEESLPEEVFLVTDLLRRNKNWKLPYKFDSNDLEGRYLSACRDLEPGEEILREKMLLIGPQLATMPVCLACYRWVDGSYLCTKCGWPLCGKKCEKNSGEHSTECKIFQDKKFKMDVSKFNYKGVEPLYDVIPPLRALALKTKRPENWKIFWNLMSHLDNWKKDPSWKESHQYIIDFLLDKLKLEGVSDDDILTIFGIFYTNDFSARIVNNDQAGSTLKCSKIRISFPLISMCSHDCNPNAIYDHANMSKPGEPPVYEVILKAKRKISKGEKILISYVDILLPTISRQKNLLEGKKFLCRCQRCVDPTSLSTYGDALLCRKCRPDAKTMKGIVLRETSSGKWKCNQCHWEKNGDEVEELMAKIQKETDELLNDPKNNRIDLFEAFLKKYEKILHPNHMFFCLVKYSLSGYYGRLPGFEMHEMKPEVINRKRQICQETLDVIEKIDQGIGVRKGMLLYELHMPMIMLTQMSFQAGILNRDQAKKEFQLALKYLKDSMDILRHEPEGNFEKNVYLGAKDSIQPIQNFVDSL